MIEEVKHASLTLSPGNKPAGSFVTGGAVVKIGGTSCTSCTMITTSRPAIFLLSWPGSAYASYLHVHHIESVEERIQGQRIPLFQSKQ